MAVAEDLAEGGGGFGGGMREGAFADLAVAGDLAVACGESSSCSSFFSFFSSSSSVTSNHVAISDASGVDQNKRKQTATDA